MASSAAFVGLCVLAAASMPEKFYKGRSQEKTLLHRPEFFLLRSPLDRTGSALTARTNCTLAGQNRPAFGVSTTSGFHRLSPTHPTRSRPRKAQLRLLSI